MKPYHKYVFPHGDFDAMYQAEDREGFDSWQQGDVRHLRLRLAQTLIADYNFNSVLEVGCGKGHSTQFFKRVNNRVVGIDKSDTAIQKARQTFPDIEFYSVPPVSAAITYDLVVIQCVLAYMPDWTGEIERSSWMGKRGLVCEYIPPTPKGFVESAAALLEAFNKHFHIERRLFLNDDVVILFGLSRYHAKADSGQSVAPDQSSSQRQ